MTAPEVFRTRGRGVVTRVAVTVIITAYILNMKYYILNSENTPGGTRGPAPEAGSLNRQTRAMRITYVSATYSVPHPSFWPSITAVVSACSCRTPSVGGRRFFSKTIVRATVKVCGPAGEDRTRTLLSTRSRATYFVPRSLLI